MAADMAALPSESSFVGGLPTDSSSNPASFSSTPPTSISDSGELANDTPKPAIESVIARLEQPVIVAASCADSSGADTDLTLPSETSRTEPSHEDNTPTRPRRSRHSEPVIYNLAKLSGTAHHGNRRPKGDNVVDRRRRTSAGASLVGSGSNASEGSSEKPGELVQDGIEALDMDWSIDQIPTPKSARSLRTKQPAQKPQPSGGRIKTFARAFSTSVLSRRSTRLSGPVSSSLTEQLASMKPRARKSFEQSHSMARELMRLADTKEFAKVEEKPVITSIWANGKYYESVEAADAAKAAADAVFRGKANLVTVTKGEKAETVAAQVDRKASENPDDNSKAQVEDEEAAPEGPPTLPPPKRQKKWLDKGLYAGQTVDDITKTITKEEKNEMAKVPFLDKPAPKNKALPLPMYNGLRTLVKGRDFKLPYDVCHPLADQPKPKEWRKITKSKFINTISNYDELHQILVGLFVLCFD